MNVMRRGNGKAPQKREVRKPPTREIKKIKVKPPKFYSRTTPKAFFKVCMQLERSKNVQDRRLLEELRSLYQRKEIVRKIEEEIHLANPGYTGPFFEDHFSKPLIELVTALSQTYGSTSERTKAAFKSKNPPRAILGSKNREYSVFRMREILAQPLKDFLHYPSSFQRIVNKALKKK